MLPFFSQVMFYVSMTLAVAISVIILRRREQAKVKMNWLLFFAILTTMIWILSVYIEEMYFPYFPKKQVEFMLPFGILSGISNVGIVLGLSFLSTFYTLLIYPHIQWKRMTIWISFTMLIIAGYVPLILIAIQKNVSLYDEVFMVINVFNVLFLIVLLYYVYKDLRVLNQSLVNTNETLTKQMKIITYFTYYGLLSQIPILILGNFVERSLISIAFINLTITMGGLTYAYLIDPRIVFVLPEKIERIIVVNNSGLLKSYKEFESKDADTPTMLISGALSAIFTVMSDFYNTEVYPKTIEFDNQLILLNWSSNFFIAAFVKRDSSLIRNSMKKTIQRIHDTYGEDSDVFTKGHSYINLDGIFDETFYFVYT